MKRERFAELDHLRGLAVSMMIIYHAAFDLQVFAGWNLDVLRGGWLILARSTLILFLLLVGISFAVSSRKRAEQGRSLWPRAMRRAAVVGGLAAVISIGTYAFDPTNYVRFGILHCIAASILLLPLFYRIRRFAILITPLTLLPWYLATLLPSEGLLPFGLTPAGFQSIDYVPLLPWFAIVLIGLWLGWLGYERYPQWRTSMPTLSMSPLRWMGRNALLIYLVHQPILVASIYVLTR